MSQRTAHLHDISKLLRVVWTPPTFVNDIDSEYNRGFIQGHQSGFSMGYSQGHAQALQQRDDS
eukprot:scaffold324833_cov77-Tisochrysis_lutea.AAC.1